MNGRAVVYVDNEGQADAQEFDFSGMMGAKEIHLYGGSQNVTFNDAYGNAAIVEEGAFGEKDIEFGNGRGDVAIVDSDSRKGNVNIIDGAGNDTVVVRGAMKTTFNMGEGRDVLVVTENSEGANVSLEGYNYEEDIIQVELPIEGIKEAIEDGDITFGDGGVIKFETDTFDMTTVDIDDADAGDAWLVRLADPDGNKSLVGFTGEYGGYVGDATLEGKRPARRQC